MVRCPVFCVEYGRRFGCRQRTDLNAMPTLTPVNQLPSSRLDRLTGFVLAGGASRRMGCRKESLLIDGESMLERQIRVLRSVACRVVVVGGPEGYLDQFDVPIVPDAVANRGPLGGIYTALLESRTEFNLVLGCDLPRVSPDLLVCLALRAMADGSDVTVPVSRDGHFQPLCAVFRRSLRYAVRTTLGLGENKLRSFFPRVHCTIVSWRELADAGFRAPVFGNMNTPDDYEYARRRIEGPGVPID
jgi:molybdopterin-guanine dinucleotide biosynthesis protein A